MWSKTFPDPDHFKHSLVISVVIHGTALTLLYFLTYGLWVAIALCGNVAHQFLFKLTQWPISITAILPAIQKFPITIGFVLVSMAYGSCGGLALICAVIMYFILLSKMYEDYLEEFVFKTASIIAKKLFGRGTESVTEQNPTQNTVQAITTTESNSANETENEKKCEKVKEKKEKKVKIIEKQKSQESKDEPETNEPTSSTSSKSDLNVGDKAVVASDPENSFEVLYNQLDPADVATFGDNDEAVEEVDEETKKKMAEREAGMLFQCFFFFALWDLFSIFRNRCGARKIDH